jgi:two-component system chemotaxis response regulator CheY
MSKTVITIDDAATMRKMVSFTLRGAGYSMLEAEDGVAALEVLKNAQVDLIITDVNMPRMDGIEFTRQARQIPALQKTPILLLTTETDGDSKARAKAAGATGWLVKPFKPEQLVAVVSKVVPAA